MTVFKSTCAAVVLLLAAVMPAHCTLGDVRPQLRVQGYTDTDGNYEMQWDDLSGAGVTIYEVWNSTAADFSTANSYYWPSVNYLWLNDPVSATRYCRVRGWTRPPENGGECTQWSDTGVQQVVIGTQEVFSIGTRDNSDAEFAQSVFESDFFPATQNAAQFSKEINLGFSRNQYIHYNLTEFAANQGITLVLDPVYNNGTGTLRVAADIWDGSQWYEAGTTLMNACDSGYINIFPGRLKTGMNDLRLRACGGTGNTSVVTWDYIECRTLANNVVWRLGRNDAGSADLSNGPFKLDFIVGTDQACQFPKEINTTWYPSQYFKFYLTDSQCQKAKILSFDACWNDGSGALVVGLERWNGSSWTALGATDVSSNRGGEIAVPADSLTEGLNEWRISASSGTDNTTVVVWDGMALFERNAVYEPAQKLLEDVLDTSLNYYLSTASIHASGLPLTALRIGNRPRYGYSNPTEWGHALQAWVVAGERGHISRAQARDNIENALNTMLTLQADPSQFKYGLFYPYYVLVTTGDVNVSSPYHDRDTRLPSGDCALLYGSLNVAEGWLRSCGYTQTADKAASVKGAMSFRSCYQALSSTEAYIAHQIDAVTGALSTAFYTHARWDIYADEGGMVAFIAYQSGSITLDEYAKLIASQARKPAGWNGHHVREAALFNEMFTWPQRSIVGYPMFGNAKERVYGVQSFTPVIRSHIAYGNMLGVDYPAFSSAMTQTAGGVALVGWNGTYVPPNLVDCVTSTAPAHGMPHALFVPCSALLSMDENTLKTLYEKWVLLRCDSSGVWHPSFSQDRYGFEVLASPWMNQNYQGADEGRYVFEELSTAYTALSIYDGLQAYGANRTFSCFAGFVPDYNQKVADTLNAAYPND